MKNWEPISEEIRRKRLTPAGNERREVVIDSDTKNEVDDQFAIAWALASSERLHVQAVYAAPFSSGYLQRFLPGADVTHLMTADPAEGMRLSKEEAERLFRLMGKDPQGVVKDGSPRYLPGPDVPVDSPAARDLIRRAHACRETLYVITIGAPTNVASALLMDPSIREKITVVWLGGQPLTWPRTLEFNLSQDLHASRVLLDSGVPLVLIPCMSVASLLSVSAPELQEHLVGRSAVGDYLAGIVLEALTQEAARGTIAMFEKTYNLGLNDGPMDEDLPATPMAPTRIIWDTSTVAWVMNHRWCPSTLVHAPHLADDFRWIPGGEDRHLIRVVNYVYRDAVFGDLFARLG